jgi:heme O synthase-like polyprenyltransferase
MALVPQIVDAVRVPVVAAGGIADGRGLVAALALGAVFLGLALRLVTDATRDRAGLLFHYSLLYLALLFAALALDLAI